MIRNDAHTRDGYQCKMCPAMAETIGYLVRPQLGGRLKLDNVLSMCRQCLDRQAVMVRSGDFYAVGAVEPVEPPPRGSVCPGLPARHRARTLPSVRAAPVHPVMSSALDDFGC